MKASAALDALRSAAKTNTNLMPSLIHAVEQRATLGEIADGLRAEWGEFQDSL